MKKVSKNLKMYICMFVAIFCAITLKAEAANVTSGSLGERESIIWTYDADTKTLILQGDGKFETVNWNVDDEIYEICSDVETIYVKDCKVSTCNNMFAGLDYVQSINFENFDTSNVTDMSGMFRGCSSLSSLDVSAFDTSSVTEMNGMFDVCKGLSSLDIRNFDTSQVTNMSGMFAECEGLSSLDIRNFDTSQVTSMNAMFYGCENLSSVDVSSFDTSNVTMMAVMFQNCRSLSSLDLSNFDTAKVTIMSAMFYGCENLRSLDVSNFDATQGELSSVFRECNALEIIYTFKGMKEGVEVELPGTFVDLNRKQTSALTKEFCNTTLINVNNLVTGVSVSPASAELKPGDTKQLHATVTPTKAAIKDVTWKSSNTAVATVDATGKVTAVAEGTATITATAKDGTGKKATCEVIVVDPVKAFVERMYTVALGRASDPSGINYWTEELLSHRKDGASISAGFIMSEEFEKKNYSNEEYLKVLYRTFFDREADEGGKAFWLEQMKAGRSRKSVLAGFVNSKEFTEICESYGITRGIMEDDATATGAGQFVERLYSIALERPSDPAGLKDWADRINNRTNTPEQVAKEFFLSPEYTGKNTSNDKYVETLYLVFMDRASEEGGKTFWVGQLNQGVSRESVLEGFAQSEEFKEIMARYGL